MTFFKGIGALVLALVAFSVFSFKLPKGDKAMGGLADAAVATFLVEAIFKYICGDFIGIKFLGEVGAASGGMGAVAAAALVGLSMGTNPVFAIAAAAAVSGCGILTGFIVAYIMSFFMGKFVKVLPPGLDVILGTLVAAALARAIAVLVDPAVNTVISTVGDSITVATTQSPLVMGLLLGGIMKVVCTSPLSSMALTAMLGLTGLPMGIAAVACFGGAFSNAMVFHFLKMGDRSRVLAVILEPLTQADIVTLNPLPIYSSSFVGGAISGVIAATMQIINNAPGTASTIPGLLAPFAFNAPGKVIIAMSMALVCGVIGGYLVGIIFKKIGYVNKMPLEES